MQKLVLLIATVALIATLGASAPTANRSVPAADAWQLDFEFAPPQRLEITLPGHSQPRRYWYMLYKVINNSGRDRLFLPAFELVYQRSDGMGRIQADMGINPAVFAAIKKQHQRAYRFLKEPVLAMGRLLQGRDNAKTTVAIWPAFDEQADRFSIYVAGLSGQTRLVANPNYNRSQPELQEQALPDGTKISMTVNPRFFTLRKVLKIDYELPGDPVSRRSIRPVEAKRTWVMR